MRIRSIRPEFWSSEDIAAMDWQVTYDGPVPKRVNTIAPMTSAAEYVYLLFDSLDELVYVGRSFRPADRFTKHRRKSWWKRVATVAIVRITEAPPHTRPPWMTYGPNTARFEALAIDRLNPPANIAAPSRLVMT
ncbi:GIY-YIG nuclease family protein [Brachybacterium sp. AOP3-A1-3]|uniref:GIY-YIG nuclease family protein n=1 Tax=Brachybacterium sp. AOP3-A1-3 TaxID=3457699 RepID=UPI004034100A